MSQNPNSFIAVSSDFEKVKSELNSLYKNFRMVEYIKDDFLLEDAKNVLKEAYVSESKIKILLLGARTYNVYAQNSLLKILEEPPKNIVFVICVPNKNNLLPTIRSRLRLKIYSKESLNTKISLDFTRLSLKDVYEFLKDKKYLAKNELLDLVQSITKEALKQGVKLRSADLEHFAKLLQLSNLNSNANVILTTQLISILRRI